MPLRSYQRLKNRAKQVIVRVSSENLSWTLKQIFLRFFFLIMFLSMLPITLVLHQFGYRRLNVNTERIGHLAAEVDCFLKLYSMGKIDSSKKYFISTTYEKVANKKLLDLWSNQIRVLKNRPINFLLNFMTYGPFLKHDVSDYVLSTGRAARYYRVNSDWGSRPSTLTFDQDLILRGTEVLRKLGIPEGSWFVCIHVRERGYSESDDGVHEYRNFESGTMLLAIQEIISRGGYCIKMGHKTSAPVLDEVNGFINYADSEYVSDEMDVFLCGSCRFFLGNTSGLFILSSIFNVPVVLTNVIPITSMPFRCGDLAIFKRIINLDKNRQLTIKEMLGSDIVHFRVGALYRKNNLGYINNTAEEIRNVTIEMLEAIEGNFYMPASGELMEKFRAMVQPNHYCFSFTSQISLSYLSDNKALLI